MENEMARVVATVNDKLKYKQRYIDGALRTIDGKDISIEDMRLDLRVLKTLRLRDIHKEGQLASYLGFRMRDEPFQSALTRLAEFGMITRKLKEWGYRGEWIELADEAREIGRNARGDGISIDKQDVVPDLVACEVPSEA
jgi:hypothetical protein